MENILQDIYTIVFGVNTLGVVGTFALALYLLPEKNINCHLKRFGMQ